MEAVAAAGTPPSAPEDRPLSPGLAEGTAEEDRAAAKLQAMQRGKQGRRQAAALRADVLAASAEGHAIELRSPADVRAFLRN